MIRVSTEKTQERYEGLSYQRTREQQPIVSLGQVTKKISSNIRSDAFGASIHRPGLPTDWPDL